MGVCCFVWPSRRCWSCCTFWVMIGSKLVTLFLLKKGLSASRLFRWMFCFMDPPIDMDNLRVLVWKSLFFPSAKKWRINLIQKFNVFHMDLSWCDSYNGTCARWTSDQVIPRQKVMPTVFFMQILYFPDILTWLDYIVVKLIPRSQCSESRTWDPRKRAEEQSVNRNVKETSKLQDTQSDDYLISQCWYHDEGARRSSKMAVSIWITG